MQAMTPGNLLLVPGWASATPPATTLGHRFMMRRSLGLMLAQPSGRTPDLRRGGVVPAVAQPRRNT